MYQTCRRIEDAAKTEIGRRLLSHHLNFLHQDRFQDVSTEINKLSETLSTEINKLSEADTYIYQREIGKAREILTSSLLTGSQLRYMLYTIIYFFGSPSPALCGTSIVILE